GNDGLMENRQGRLDNPSNVIDVDGNSNPGQGGENPGQTATSVTGGKGQLTPPDGLRPKNLLKIEEMDDIRTFLELAEKLRELLGTTASFNKIKDSFLFQALEDGLLIQLIELDKAPLFEEGQDVFTLPMQQSLAVISKELTKLPNKI